MILEFLFKSFEQALDRIGCFRAVVAIASVFIELGEMANLIQSLNGVGVTDARGLRVQHV